VSRLGVVDNFDQFSGAADLAQLKTYSRVLPSREAVAQKGSRAGISVWVALENSGMAQNFLVCDPEQSFLLPPDLRDWLPEDHLAWFVVDAVGVMDLSAFYAAYREDGLGRAAYEPSMMVALILYCWSRGMRSSRRIERACLEDVACRVIAANQRPDHATIARFIERHQGALAGLFGEVLVLCDRAVAAVVARGRGYYPDATTSPAVAMGGVGSSDAMFSRTQSAALSVDASAPARFSKTLVEAITPSPASTQ
jgi:transposase